MRDPEKSIAMSYRDGDINQCTIMGLAINRREALLITHEESGLNNGQMQDITAYSVKQVLRLFAEIESESKRMDDLKNKWKADVVRNERGK